MGQKADKKKSDKFLPVHIRYSDKVAYPSDSVKEFIKAYLSIKGVPVLDSADVMDLAQREIESVWKANVKKGDPLPDPVKLSSKTKAVAYVLTLSVYTNPQQKEFLIDSIHWGSSRVPVNFEKNNKRGGYYPDKEEKKSLFTILKESIDQLVESVFHKED